MNRKCEHMKHYLQDLKPNPIKSMKNRVETNHKSHLNYLNYPLFMITYESCALIDSQSRVHRKLRVCIFCVESNSVAQ